jgi:hypothetical protein
MSKIGSEVGEERVVCLCLDFQDSSDDDELREVRKELLAERVCRAPGDG